MDNPRVLLISRLGAGLSVCMVLFGQRIEFTPSTAIRFESYCNKATPGQSEAELQWLATKDQLQQHQLDVTVYMDGFQRGLFKTVQPSVPGRLFIVPPPERVGVAERSRVETIPGLRNLTLSEISRPEAAAPVELRRIQPLRLRSRLFSAASSVVVRVEGLQGGLRYFWRVSGAGNYQPATSFLAAVCPVDEPEPRRVFKEAR